jgi:teichuronic acid biosynthesis glycosyltransferase TuaC
VTRVLFLSNAYPSAERPYYGSYIRSSADALRRAGVEVRVLAVPGYRGKQRYARGVVRVLAANAYAPYDIVHAHHGLMGLVGRVQVRRPLVISYTGGDLHGNPDTDGHVAPARAALAMASKRVAHLAAATITKTEQLARLLPARVRDRNTVIPDGVDLARFRPIDRGVAREQLGWDPREQIVVFMADPKRVVKGYPLAQAAVERVNARRPGLRFRIAATVPHEVVPLWMAAADALVFTSSAEGSPNVIREAMASELPAVSTPVGDVPELFQGVPGCVVRPADPDAIAEGLELALDHGRTPAARAAMASMDIDESARRVRAVYERVLSR